MKRELKFCAWDKINKKMWYNVQNAYDTLGEHCEHSAEEQKTCKCRLEDPLMVHSFGELLKDTERYEVMQYIGLKDKNDRDIFEGDIVKYTTNYYGKLREDNKQIVEWLDDMEHDGFGQPLGTGYCLRGYNWEVIGNIYENPELLK